MRAQRRDPLQAEEQVSTPVPCGAVFAPTRTGTTARMISRFKPAPWIVSMSADPAVRQGLVTVSVQLSSALMPRLELLPPDVLRKQQSVTLVAGVPLLHNVDSLTPVLA